MKIVLSIILSCTTSLFHGWNGFHQNKRMRSVRLYSTSSEQEQLSAIHNFFDNRIERSIQDFISKLTQSSSIQSSSSSRLQERPGFAYGLGVDTWAAGGVYTGSLSSWNQFPNIRWMSKSILERVDEIQFNTTSNITTNDNNTTLKTAASSALLKSKPTDRISRQVDYHIILGPSNDIPHLKIRLVRTTTNEFQLHLDFIPRQELLSHINTYYDKYFQGYDILYFQKTDTAVREFNFVRNPPSMSVLSRLLMSPFAIHLSASSDHESTKKNSNSKSSNSNNNRVNELKEEYSMILELLGDHLRLWKSWYDDYYNNYNIAYTQQQQLQQEQQQMSLSGTPPTITTTTTTSDTLLRNTRDQALMDLLHEEIKYSYAEILGGAFAPKATDIALAMMGPDFISTFVSPPSAAAAVISKSNQATTVPVPAASSSVPSSATTITAGTADGINNTQQQSYPSTTATTTQADSSQKDQAQQQQQQQHEVTVKFQSKLKPIT